MKKYIDAELLKQILKPAEWGTPDERWVPEHEIGAMLDYFPAADVVEVRRGRWEHSWGDEWFCTVCGHIITTEGSWERPWQKYCEECGAKMDEVSK